MPVIDCAEDGSIEAVRYEYPKEADYLVRDVMPLLEAAGVQLVFYGHSHLWNRFVSNGGMHFLETSNVGNSYGAALGDRKREVPTTYQEKYVATGDPYELEPVVPTIAPCWMKMVSRSQRLPVTTSRFSAFLIPQLVR